MPGPVAELEPAELLGDVAQAVGLAAAVETVDAADAQAALAESIRRPRRLAVDVDLQVAAAGREGAGS